MTLTWYKSYVLTDMTDMTTRDAEGNNPAINAPTETTFAITDAKFYFPIVTV